MANDGDKRTFWTDWWRKLFALIFALISFFLINGKIAQNRTIENVKVEFNLEEENVVTVLDENITAKIVVNTTLPLGSLKSDSYHVVVNISPRRDDHKYRIKVNVGPQNVRKKLFLPSVKSVTLSRDSVELDPIIQKSVPILTQITGMTRPGYTTTMTLNPETVTVEGATEKLKNLRFISSEDLVLTPEVTNFTCRLSLISPSNDIRIIGSDSVEVNAKIVDINEVLTKKYPDVPICIVNEHPQLYAVEKMSAKSGFIEVRGLKSIIDAYMNNEVMLYIDLGEAKGPGAQRLSVHPGNLPPKARAEIKYSPDYVEVVLFEVSKANASDTEAGKEDEKEGKGAEAPKAEERK